MKRPDFFIAGAPKCGTSSLYDYLRQHSDVFMPDYKEPNYFGRDLVFDPAWCVRDRRAYETLFTGAGSAARIGEASTYSLYSRSAAEEIFAYSPGASIIAMFRDPVDMVASLHAQYLWNCNENIADFNDAYGACDDRRRGRRIPREAHFRQGLYYDEIAKYGKQIRRYFRLFGEDRVKVVLFEDFISDTPAVFDSVLEFLGLGSYTPEFRRVNPTKPLVLRHLNRLLLNTPGCRTVVQRLIPPSWKRSFQMGVSGVFGKHSGKPPMSATVRRRLCETYADEVRMLGSLIGRDLSSWCQPSCERQA